MNRENQSRNGVQRNLFGTAPNDHNKIQENLMREASRITKEKSEIWNFDFEKFEPLPPGRYKWERVGKRLQTRTSPTVQDDSTSTTCTKTMEKIAPGNKRHYNLRTREEKKQGGLDYFRPIEPCSKVGGVSSEGTKTVAVYHTDLGPRKRTKRLQQMKRKKEFVKLTST